MNSIAPREREGREGGREGGEGGEGGIRDLFHTHRSSSLLELALYM